MGEVLAMPARSPGRVVIDRMARAMAHEKGRQWDRMTRARQDQLRGQAKAALRAFRPSDNPADADIDLAVVAWMGLGAGHSPSRLVIELQTYIDEVLR